MREQILEAQNILLGAPSESREDAIRRVGQMLVDAGFAKEDYIYGMLQREKAFSTSVESIAQQLPTTTPSSGVWAARISTMATKTFTKSQI